MENIDFLKKLNFKKMQPLSYNDAWFCNTDNLPISILREDSLINEKEDISWSKQLEELHEEPTRSGWIEIYERKCVLKIFSKLIGNSGKRVLEFGASSGYMAQDVFSSFQNNVIVATDLYIEGLESSYKINNRILHIQCDINNAPFESESMDFVYGLNVLEHIEDDIKTIEECYRLLKPGGYCLFVVPRGPHLYDYYDEMLYHKRRYAKNELREKCNNVGFEVIQNFHFAWLCYPAFWFKKRLNRYVGARLTRNEKLQRVERDINKAMYSPLGSFAMVLEHMLSKCINPSFGIRELIVLKK